MTQEDKIQEAYEKYSYLGDGIYADFESFEAGYKAALAIPEGWKLVPITPTPKMIHAAYTDRNGNFGSESQWKAMLDAAPSPE